MRYIPNLISAIRLATVPVLIWLALTGADRAFAWLLVAAGITDILDGWLARKYGWVSKVGALLDSTADISIVLVVLYAMWTLHHDVFVYHGAVVWAILGVWSLANLIGLYRYHRLPSFHTTSARIGLILFGLFVLTLFFYGFVPWLLYACGLVCFLAGVESLILVILLDHWRPNLRGGIRALIRAKMKRTSRSG